MNIDTEQIRTDELKVGDLIIIPDDGFVAASWLQPRPPAKHSS